MLQLSAEAANEVFSNEDYLLFREFVREKTGIVYSAPRRRIFENRLWSRIQALSLTNPGAYFRYLTFHQDKGEEFLRLVSVLTNNETFFFREQATLNAIVKMAQQKAPARFRILSAGSSSGEELGSLAILSREAGIDPDRMEFTGVDIDVTMVNTAQSGLYRNKSFRSTDPELLVRFFSPEGEHRRLKPNIHRQLQFRWANLVDETTMRFPRPFDAILCRNVLIYFDQATIERVVRTLHGLLATDGVLVAGVSESLANLPFLFDPVRQDGIVVYKKAAIK